MPHEPAPSSARLPRIRTDFNSNSLANRWTQEDLKRQGIELRDGMRCVFYDLDAEGDVSGFLHTDAVVWWDANSDRFRIDMRTVQYRFTPGDDISVLDAEYP
jgi:hypothetical protein